MSGIVQQWLMILQFYAVSFMDSIHPEILRQQQKWNVTKKNTRRWNIWVMWSPSFGSMLLFTGFHLVQVDPINTYLDDADRCRKDNIGMDNQTLVGELKTKNQTVYSVSVSEKILWSSETILLRLILSTYWGLGPVSILNSLCMFGDFHCKDKMVMRLSYLYNGNTYTDKMYLYIEMAPWSQFPSFCRG